MNFLATIFNTKSVQNKLDHGDVINKTISVFFQILTFISGIVGIILWTIHWKYAENLNFGQVLGFIFLKLVTLFIILYITKFLILRYKEISEFENQKFIIGPIFSLLIRTGGEAAFLTYVFLSLPTMVSMWFSISISRSVPFLSEVFYQFRFLDIESYFLISIIVFLVMILVGFIVLIVTRYLSESIEAFFSIANDIKGLSKKELIPDFKDEE